MSMTLMVVVGSGCRLTTTDMSSHANELDLSIAFEEEADLKTHSGFLPVRVSDVDTGVETYFDEGPEVLDKIREYIDIGEDKVAVVTFRWGSSLQEGATAFYIAYLLASQCGAIIYDTASDEVISEELARYSADSMMSF